VASTHAIWWNGIKPVFVDIEPNTFTLDPEKIEAAITDKTTAILPVHVYGNPCNIEAIQKIADKHSLKIIYDAAHAFGVKKDGISIAQYGNLSVLSFHATKVFNTFEGGAIICHDENTKRRIDDLKNFGIHDETTVVAPGINAKMNEFQAALGILQLQYIDAAIEKRKDLVLHYRKLLKPISGIHFLKDINAVTHNYSYFPVLINSKIYGKTRDELYEYLKQHEYNARRYFYPLISHFPPYNDLKSSNIENLINAENISKNILCLPLYPDLSFEHVETICSLLKAK
jgi:dTDP-4-amino-4,6-dideoxygalactose transaminase